MKSQNILLILTDQQSADALGCANPNPWLHTPNLDALAASGTRFDRAYCSHPLCMPSRSSMMSGLLPHETGILSNTNLGFRTKEFTALGQVFDQAGYDTGYVGKWHVSFPIDDRSRAGYRYTAAIGANGVDPVLPGAAEAFLREERECPWFLTVSFNNPHNICEWAREQRPDLPDGDFGPLPPDEELPPLRPNHQAQEDEPEVIAMLRRSYQASPLFPVGGFGEREWRMYQWAYYKMTGIVDRRIGEVLRLARDHDGGRPTAVVFLSDHGDAQGAHRWNQKTVLIDESTRVPLIVSRPGETGGGVSRRLVQTGTDLLPTLCDLAGLEPPASARGTSALAPGDGGPVVVETRFAQGAEKIDPSIPVVDGRMVRTERLKYCVYNYGKHRESLVDLQEDPGEQVNLARRPEYAGVLDEHRSLLRDFAARTGDSFPE